MLIFGIILIVLGYLLGISIFYTVGVILLVVGLILFLVGPGLGGGPDDPRPWYGRRWY